MREYSNILKNVGINIGDFEVDPFEESVGGRFAGGWRRTRDGRGGALVSGKGAPPTGAIGSAPHLNEVGRGPPDPPCGVVQTRRSGSDKQSPPGHPERESRSRYSNLKTDVSRVAPGAIPVQTLRPYRPGAASALGIFLLEVGRGAGEICRSNRAVAQLGRALEWGSRGREFESLRPDFFYKPSTAIS
jgi:hypothetical protein